MVVVMEMGMTVTSIAVDTWHAPILEPMEVNRYG
jgi:hypothetical protein